MNRSLHALRNYRTLFTRMFLMHFIVYVSQRICYKKFLLIAHFIVVDTKWEKNCRVLSVFIFYQCAFYNKIKNNLNINNLYIYIYGYILIYMIYMDNF